MTATPKKRFPIELCRNYVQRWNARLTAEIRKLEAEMAENAAWLEELETLADEPRSANAA